MASINALRKIADLDYEVDNDNTDGYVAEVGSVALAKSYCDQLEAAGYDTSWSTDDRRDDQHAFVWVKGLGVGEEVEGGETTEDYDIGVIRAVDGAQAVVAWRRSATTTTQSVDTLRQRDP